MSRPHKSAFGTAADPAGPHRSALGIGTGRELEHSAPAPTPARARNDEGARVVSPTPLRKQRLNSRLGSLGHGLLQRGASGYLHAVAGRDLDLLTGTGVAAGARSALHPLDAQQAGDLDGLALAEGLDQDLLQRTQRGVGVGLDRKSVV